MLCDPSGTCTWTELDETLVKNHSVAVSNVEPGITYHVTVKSADASGNETLSDIDQVFTTGTQTDTTPPVISSISVSSITESSALIKWTTDEKATSQVEFGTSATYGSETPLDTSLTTSHSVNLSGLDADTTYHFSVKSKDSSDNEAASDTDKTFKTLAHIAVGPEVGNRAPDFTLDNLAGGSITLSDLQGKIVMVNFWTTWCGPCVAEMPHFQAIHENWSGTKDLVILAINRKENPGTAQSFIDSEGYTFTVLLDPGPAGDDYDITTIPRTFFIDTEGIIQEVRIGSFGSQSEICGNAIRSVMIMPNSVWNTS